MPIVQTNNKTSINNKDIVLKSAFSLKEVGNISSKLETAAAAPIVLDKPISIDIVILAIKMYAEQKLNAGLKLLHVTFNTCHINLFENQVILKVANEMQREVCKNVHQDLLEFLYTELQNNQIKLQFEVTMNAINTLKPYLTNEKLEALVKKNPKVEDLKNKLELIVNF